MSINLVWYNGKMRFVVYLFHFNVLQIYNASFISRRCFRNCHEFLLVCFVAVSQAPNIHPGSISSTGRQRPGPTATSTGGAQLIGGGVSPTLFTSPVCSYLFWLCFTNSLLYINYYASLYTC